MDKRILSIAVGALFAAGAASGPVLAAGQYDTQKSGSQSQQSEQSGSKMGAQSGQSGQSGSSQMGAQSGQSGQQPQFSQVDQDGDKNISKTEAEQAGLKQLVDNWDKADRDSDDVLDDAEFSVFIEQQGGAGSTGGSSQQMKQQGGSMGGSSQQKSQQPGESGSSKQ